MAVKQSEQYQMVIRSLSDRLVEAQTPIRVLDAIKWDDSIRDQFFRDGCKKLPDVGPEYYRSRPLAFDPAERLQAFQDIERDIPASWAPSIRSGRSCGVCAVNTAWCCA